MKHTGWQYVAVPGLIPDEIFFEHLANRRFPAASFMRKPNELGYLEVPDVFHDVFGHAPLLTNPFMADFIQAFGLAALNAISIGKLDQLARVYWYTIETGLVQQKNGLRAFGAAISSSAKETTFALEDKSPNRIQFDLERVMRTDFYIYDLQETYFVLNDLEDFLELARFDFLPLYKKLDGTEDIGRGDTTESDLVLQYGTGAYHLKNQTPKLALVTA
jgi:phenylalanine-4-hydroxylase